ncbi:MAG: type IX secretion system outer membrane channel protein PorV [Cytophagales bacterium]|nr:type IX secretion system outer membrane channel protein PorV [Bernardetiaceae bacterium]MDW8205387.1 type IX secretion system outer membrane channel protein PorV [Cytophagales bacterium]
MFLNKQVIVALCISWLPMWALAQNSGSVLGQDQSRRVIPVAVPFLTIAPDSRSGAMGDVGAAISPDANAIHWNPAKLAFIEQASGFSLSYNPWLIRLVNDMWLSYLSGYKRLSKLETVGGSIRYMNLGSMQFTDLLGNPLQEFNPREIAIDITYARKLSSNLSIAPAFRFIHSNLAGNISNAGTNINAQPGNTVAVDLGVYYQKAANFGAIPGSIAFGGNISNVGLKLTYNDPESRDFIPTNLRLGTALTGEFDEYNKLTFAFDLNKLMVPSPVLQNGRLTIPNRSLVSGIFGSFSDAPLSEELQEIMLAVGMEYWYNDIFALRGGYFHEADSKGGRKFATVGAGLKFNVLNINFAYLIPMRQNMPLADTLRFSLLFNFNGKSTPANNETDISE